MLVVKGIGTKQFFQWTTSPTAHRSQSNCWLGMKSYRCGQQYHLPTQYLQLIHLLHRKIRHLIQLNLVKYCLFLLVLKPNKTPIYCVLSFSQPASPQVALASHLRKSRVTIPADPLSVPNIAQVGSEKSSPALRESNNYLTIYFRIQVI